MSTPTTASSVKRPASPSPISPEQSSAKRARENEAGEIVNSPVLVKAGAKTATNGAKQDPAEPSDSLPPPPPPKMDDASISAEPSTAASGSSSAKPADGTQINMRCLIVTQDASIIIGRGGAHVNEIREKSSARVTVSESIPGNPERILNVSGQLDAVAKAFGLIVRRINDEPFDVASLPGSRAVTIKFIIPHSRMGSVIGKGGSKIKEIQEASGARLNASEAMLPGSSERVLSVSGVADAVHIAVYYIGTILLEWMERNPHHATNGATGTYRQFGARSGPGAGPGGPGGPGGAGMNMGGNGQFGAPGQRGPGGGGMGGMGMGMGMGGQAPFGAGAPGPGAGGANMPGAHTQQIFIPNALVGAIIGKGGQKINEIRVQSQCQIRVTDPGTPAVPGQPVNPEERLVTITGQPQAINVAVGLLYARLEQEKQKAQMGGNA